MVSPPSCQVIEHAEKSICRLQVCQLDPQQDCNQTAKWYPGHIHPRLLKAQPERIRQLFCCHQPGRLLPLQSFHSFPGLQQLCLQLCNGYPVPCGHCPSVYTTSALGCMLGSRWSLLHELDSSSLCGGSLIAGFIAAGEGQQAPLDCDFVDSERTRLRAVIDGTIPNTTGNVLSASAYATLGMVCLLLIIVTCLALKETALGEHMADMPHHPIHPHAGHPPHVQ